MSERQVQRCLGALVELRIIGLGDQRQVAATISREDRRPICYNIRMSRGGSRSNDAASPVYRQTGKSRVELKHHAAAVELFGNARSGITMTNDAFISRRSWTTDISIDHRGATVVIEYDGVYWHRTKAKILVDQRKSLDLLAAGYVVVRLREDDLPPSRSSTEVSGDSGVFGGAAPPNRHGRHSQLDRRPTNWLISRGCQPQPRWR